MKIVTARPICPQKNLDARASHRQRPTIQWHVRRDGQTDHVHSHLVRAERYDQIGAEALPKVITDELNVAKLEVSRISPVLGAHTGPGIVGVAVVPVE